MSCAISPNVRNNAVSIVYNTVVLTSEINRFFFTITRNYGITLKVLPRNVAQTWWGCLPVGTTVVWCAKPFPETFLKKKTVSPSTCKKHRNALDTWPNTENLHVAGQQRPHTCVGMAPPTNTIMVKTRHISSVPLILSHPFFESFATSPWMWQEEKRSTEPVWNAWIQTIFEKWRR